MRHGRGYRRRWYDEVRWMAWLVLAGFTVGVFGAYLMFGV